mgnify:CR=1 FL=1
MNKRNFMRRLMQDRRGAALPMMAAGLLPVLAGIGAAVDIGRIVTVRAQMQAGVDAGALAGARVFGLTDDRTGQVAAYFHANMPEGYAGSDPIAPVADFREVQGVNRVHVTATTDLPMVFMRLFGIGHRAVSVEAVAEMQPKPLEVMVVLDNTGSMSTGLGTGNRMDALHTAMHDFIDILHQGEETRRDLAMGIVTYTVTTNVGQILRDSGVDIQNRDGFTNITTYTGGSNDAQVNPLAWKGCVENDPSVRDLPADPNEHDLANAWDTKSILPGEEGRPGVLPYHYPPVTTTATSTAAWSNTARVTSNYKSANSKGSGRNNLYRLSPGGDMAIAQTLANLPAYKQRFYDFYIGLNHGTANQGDDVIVTPSGGYYNPASGGEYKVEYSRLPYITATTDWDEPTINYGYPTRPGRTLAMATPNWQCPEPALPLAYGQNADTYHDYIDQDNVPLNPASGTLHHIGMLWGYRLLTRDDVFERNNPVPSERPLRALIFMTDGVTEANGDAAWYGAYGGLREKRITTSTNPTTFKNQIMRRFGAVCENARRDGIAVYIVSVQVASGDARDVFRTCAGSNYLETSNQTQIQDAFRQIAVDLVDLHLTE